MVEVTLSISGSVGRAPRGLNSPTDVRNVQLLLNNRSGPINRVPETGRFDAETLAAIIEFQRTVVKMPQPDGLITPTSSTLLALNDPANQWGGAAASAGTDDPKTAFEAELARTLSTQDQAEFGQFYRDKLEDLLKGMQGAGGRAEDARRLARVLQFIRTQGMTAEESYNIIGRIPARQFEAFMKVLVPTSAFGKAIAKFGSKAEKLGFLVLAIDVALYSANGDFGAAAGEIYKFVMGKLIPWAGMIEGLGSLLDVVLPGNVKSKTFVKALRSLDPIGLGGAGLDAIGSIIKFAIYADNQQQADLILNRAVERLKKGPAAILQAPGEYIGDKVWHWLND